MIDKIEKIENLLKIGDYNKMFRVNYNGFRIYIQENPFAYYSGLTGALSSATFKGDPDYRRIKGWREGMIDSFGSKNANDFLEMTADFGTLLHMATITIKEKGCINWNEEKDKAFEYFVNCYREKFLEPDLKVIKKQTYEYQKHVASLLQFCYERVQEIYAVETPAKWESLKIATPIDIYCSCRQTEKGVFANTTINLKTSSQISKSQMEQVACEMHMWNETYGEGSADFTSILRTKDWTEGKTPTYEYKYINSEDAEKLVFLCSQRLKLCLESDANYLQSPINKEFSGVTKIGEQPVIISKTLEEEWNNTKKEISTGSTLF
jgi:hypothetical protein